MPVTWKQHPKHTWIEVSDTGLIRWHVNHELVTPRRDNKGYLFYHLHQKESWDARQHTLFVHQLVLETFVGPCPKGQVTRHLNGIRDDNCLSNLAWGTHRQNHLDSVKHGTRAKLFSKEEVFLILDRQQQGKSANATAQEFSVVHSSIQQIWHGELVKDYIAEYDLIHGITLDRSLPLPLLQIKLTCDQVQDIRLDHRSGKSNASIARKFDVSHQTVQHILSGRTWKHLPMPTPSAVETPCLTFQP